ncbi:MAG: site-specific integrase [Actinobacteria bacterium]|nr:site-specific integrase [Actinomycetota bacterium]
MAGQSLKPQKTSKPNIYKRGKNYLIRYYVDGVQKWETVGVRMKDAEALLNERQRQVRLGELIRTEDVTFKEFAEKWIATHRSKIRERTLISYEGHLKKAIPFFGRHKLRQITPELIEEFISSLAKEGLSPASQGTYLRTLKVLFNRAVEWNYINRSPAQFVRPPRKVKREIDFLTPEEIAALIDAALPEHRALIMTACLTGMRRGELLGLQWSDVDFRSNTIFVRNALYKGKLDELKSQHSRRKIAIPEILVRELKTHQARQAVELPSNELDLVFPNTAGNPMDGNNLVKRIFEPTLKRADLRRIRFHDLRHSFASLLINQNESIKFIQRTLGHSSAQVTLDVYSHLMPDAGEQAAKRVEESIFGKSENKSLV